MNHHGQLLIENGVSRTFCLGWPVTAALLISASQVAGITGVSHQCLALFFYFLKERCVVLYAAVSSANALQTSPVFR
jgi:hypothetical protein